MIETWVCTNVNGETVEFNTDTLSIIEYSVDTEIASADRNKFQRQGNWPAFTYLRRALHHIEGDILQNDADNAIAARFNILRILLPENEIQRDRRLGTMEVQFSGMSEAFMADYTIDGYEFPLTWEKWSTIRFMLTFKTFSAYWEGVSTGSYYPM